MVGVDTDELLTIGEIARRAGVATSTVRYYERRGLLRPDARRSGQRRYRASSLRRLVFIGMLQDAGLSLDDIAGVLDAGSVDEWKQIGRQQTPAFVVPHGRRGHPGAAGELADREQIISHRPTS